MVVFKDGCAFDVCASDLVAYLRVLAAGQPASLDEFGVEIGDYAGDLTQLSPATARVMQAALSSRAIGPQGSLNIICVAQSDQAIQDPERALTEKTDRAA